MHGEGDRAEGSGSQQGAAPSAKGYAHGSLGLLLPPGSEWMLFSEPSWSHLPGLPLLCSRKTCSSTYTQHSPTPVDPPAQPPLPAQARGEQAFRSSGQEPQARTLTTPTGLASADHHGRGKGQPRAQVLPHQGQEVALNLTPSPLPPASLCSTTSCELWHVAPLETLKFSEPQLQPHLRSFPPARTAGARGPATLAPGSN